MKFLYCEQYPVVKTSWSFEPDTIPCAFPTECIESLMEEELFLEDGDLKFCPRAGNEVTPTIVTRINLIGRDNEKVSVYVKGTVQEITERLNSL